MRSIKASGLGFTRLLSPLRYFQRRPIFALGTLLIGASVMSLGASFVQNRPDPATACANIANLTTFPVTPTQITLAKWNPSGEVSDQDFL
jgi:hypothetical protein